MAKIVINDIESGFMSQNAINEAFNTIESEFQNKVLYRDNPSGEPNQMENDLDMNNFDVINVGTISADDIQIGGQSFEDALDALAGIDESVASANASAASAANSATSAGNSATSASSSATSAASSAASTAATLAAFEVLLDTFDDRYLGAKASDPSTDNDGNPLVAGTVYYNTTDNELKFYNGTTWESPSASAEASATNALNSANDAADSADAAASSASSASTSASNASSSASSASSSASSASSLASSASSSASSASTSASNASSSATLASQWATKTTGTVSGGEYSAKYYAQQAASEASDASTSADSAQTYATNSLTYAGNAANSASSASSSASSAATSAASAASIYDQFDDRYLGSKGSNPTTDNDGASLIEGAMYWNSVSKKLKVYNGTAWEEAVNIGPVDLDDLTDVVISSPTPGQVLKYNGTSWINDTDSTGSSGELPAGSFDYGLITVAVDINVDYGSL